MSKDGMLAAIALAAGPANTPDEKIEVTPETLAAHFPSVARALRDEGALAERQRIAGIEQAALPGHEAIIAAHKADGSKTPADAAFAIIQAEKAQATARGASLDEDETKLKGLKSSLTDQPGSGADQSQINPRETAAKARAYIAKQAAKGITVDVPSAVKHILEKGE